MAAERFPVEAGHIMMFARAIGDDNPIYRDAAYAAATDVGGIIAPPTFVQASAHYDPDYPLRPHPGQPWFGSGRTPSGRSQGAAGDGGAASGGAPSGGGLHAEQHFEYHRPLRAGETLTVIQRPGRSWEKQGRRGGNLQFRETITEYRAEDGELVVTARGVGVRTGRVVQP